MSTQLLFRISVFALAVSVHVTTFASDDETDPDTANVVAQKGIRDKHFGGFPRKYSPPKPHVTLVKGGDMLKVTLNNGDRFSGRYSFYTNDSIGIVDAKYTYEKGRQEFRGQSRPDIGYGRYGFKALAKDEIRELAKGKRHLLQGLLLGLSVGGLIGCYIYEAEYEPSRVFDPHYEQPSPLLLLGPTIGGAVLGAIIGGKISTYKRISIESTRFSLECIRF